VYEYPLKGEIRFQDPSNVARFTTTSDPIDGFVEFEISQAGR